MVVMPHIRLWHVAARLTVFGMSTSENKQLLQAIFAERAKGNHVPFREAMADDFTWTIIGSTPWSGTYRGKQTVLCELTRPLLAQFAEPYMSTPERFIAEGEYVVVESRGRVTTTRGEPYNNTYCFVFRVVGGELRELTEYCDTELVAHALGPPDSSLLERGSRRRLHR
jgi:ketosteroid isomerase-like protein